MWPAPRPTFVPSGILIHRAVWPQQTWAENWGLCPFLGGAGSRSGTMWPGPRPTSIPSGILIRRTFGHNTTLQTDNGPIAYGKSFYKRLPKNKNEFIGVNIAPPLPYFPPKTAVLGQKVLKNPCKHHKYANLCLKCLRIAGIPTSCRKLGSRNTIVTLDFSPEVETRQSHARILKNMRYNA